MSEETTNVIIEQTKLMQLDLIITIQKMKIKELDARAETLRARSQMERFRLNQMTNEFKGLEDGKKN
ncbi:MAG: hypothetical protein DRQ78_07625 [Epsilonproteobacteria bacterium]|nr:MAG: hypothetical protein DRQ78_07625 [Campylobacterota bacterium]